MESDWIIYVHMIYFSGSAARRENGSSPAQPKHPAASLRESN